VETSASFEARSAPLPYPTSSKEGGREAILLDVPSLPTPDHLDGE
jgi:hypothetical protein